MQKPAGSQVVGGLKATCSQLEGNLEADLSSGCTGPFLLLRPSQAAQAILCQTYTATTCAGMFAFAIQHVHAVLYLAHQLLLVLRCHAIGWSCQCPKRVLLCREMLSEHGQGFMLCVLRHGVINLKGEGWADTPACVLYVLLNFVGVKCQHGRAGHA